MAPCVCDLCATCNADPCSCPKDVGHPGATLDEVHITIEQFEDEVVYEPDGTVVIASLGIRHRCPDGTPCADYSARAIAGLVQ